MNIDKNAAGSFIDFLQSLTQNKRDDIIFTHSDIKKDLKRIYQEDTHSHLPDSIGDRCLRTALAMSYAERDAIYSVVCELADQGRELIKEYNLLVLANPKI